MLKRIIKSKPTTVVKHASDCIAKHLVEPRKQYVHNTYDTCFMIVKTGIVLWFMTACNLVLEVHAVAIRFDVKQKTQHLM